MINRAQFVRDKGKTTISMPEAWDLKVVMGRDRDAIVSRIESHYVVTITTKLTSMDERLSLLSTHLKKCFNVHMNIGVSGMVKEIMALHYKPKEDSNGKEEKGEHEDGDGIVGKDKGRNKKRARKGTGKGRLKGGKADGCDCH